MSATHMTDGHAFELAWTQNHVLHLGIHTKLASSDVDDLFNGLEHALREVPFGRPIFLLVTTPKLSDLVWTAQLRQRLTGASNIVRERSLRVFAGVVIEPGVISQMVQMFFRGTGGLGRLRGIQVRMFEQEDIARTWLLSNSR